MKTAEVKITLLVEDDYSKENVEEIVCEALEHSEISANVICTKIE
jgi:hypothetical protein